MRSDRGVQVNAVRITYCYVTTRKPAGELFTFTGTERQFQQLMRGSEQAPDFIKWSRVSTVDLYRP
jgi:hypothetical protein